MNWWFVEKDFANGVEVWEGRNKKDGKIHTYEYQVHTGRWTRLNDTPIIFREYSRKKLEWYRQNWIAENIKFETL